MSKIYILFEEMLDKIYKSFSLEKSLLILFLLLELFLFFNIATLTTTDSYWFLKLSELIGSDHAVEQWIGFWSPLYPFTLKLFPLILGNSPLVLKIPSFCFGVFSLLVFFKLCKSLGISKRVSCFATFLFAISAPLVAYQNMLMTETGTVFFLLSTLLYLSSFNKLDRKSFVFLGLLLAVSYYWRSFFFYWWVFVIAILFIKAKSLELDKIKLTKSILLSGSIFFICISPWLLQKPHFSYGNQLIIQGMIRSGLITDYKQILNSEYIDKIKVPENGALKYKNQHPIFMLAKSINKKLESQGISAFGFLVTTACNQPSRYLSAITYVFNRFVSGGFRSNAITISESASSLKNKKMSPSQEDLFGKYGLLKLNSASFFQLYKYFAWSWECLYIFGLILTPFMFVYALLTSHFPILLISSAITFFTAWHCLLLVVIPRYSLPLFPLVIILIVYFVEIIQYYLLRKFFCH